MLMMQNFASNPNNNCKIITDEVINTGFLYLINHFIILTAT